ncbi:bile acid:sodium symporter [Zeimonas arvi]|uniref:bile acid:sodium symporter n=1 Tax=Zeimonas arvi TaxID=2498847 RepID=UPI00164EF8FD|nr:bile acid:sodium symporter [Zeimonas arvi]
MRRFLGILGRWARWALPAGVFVGVVLPDLAALLRPLLTAAVIGTLTSALLRLDWSHLAAAVRRPALPATIAAWQLLASPLLAWGASALVGLPPDLRLLLVLQAAAPPIGSAAVFAMILGLDGVLAVVGTVATTLLLPVTLTPLVALLLPGAGIEVDLAAFFARVTLLVLLPFALAWGLRRLIGVQRLARNDGVLGGLNVLLLVIFAIAVMDGVTARLLRDPGFIGLLLAMACAATAALHLAGYLLFRRAGIAAGYQATILSGNRNMGLMLVVTAGTAGEAFSLYVGVAQIPMYFAPLLLMPFLRRSLRGEPPR